MRMAPEINQKAEHSPVCAGLWDSIIIILDNPAEYGTVGKYAVSMGIWLAQSDMEESKTELAMYAIFIFVITSPQTAFKHYR